eukprot:5431502-Lingulodinium_polyedra.AAC.1
MKPAGGTLRRAMRTAPKRGPERSVMQPPRPKPLLAPSAMGRILSLATRPSMARGCRQTRGQAAERRRRLTICAEQ